MWPCVFWGAKSSHWESQSLMVWIWNVTHRLEWLDTWFPSARVILASHGVSQSSLWRWQLCLASSVLTLDQPQCEQTASQAPTAIGGAALVTHLLSCNELLTPQLWAEIRLSSPKLLLSGTLSDCWERWQAHCPFLTEAPEPIWWSGDPLLSFNPWSSLQIPKLQRG